MTVRSIGSVVNTGFVARLSASAPNTKTSDAIQNFPSSINGISDGLRLAARRVATGFQTTNNAISALNFSRDTLVDLEKIVTKVVGLAARAQGQSDTGQRKSLDDQFRKLGTEFLKVVNREGSEDVNLISKEGLDELLTGIGLDPDAVEEIGRLFDQFNVLSKEDATFADERTKGPRPLRPRPEETEEIETINIVYTPPNLDLLSNEVNVTTSTQASNYTAADFDGDGDNDILTNNRGSTHSFYIENNGDGTFQPPVTSPTGADGDFVAAGLFNGDAYQDLWTSHGGGNYIGFRAGNGDGTFAAEVTIAGATQPGYFTVGDFDEDGEEDLIVVAYGYNSARILTGNGDGTVAYPGDITSPNGTDAFQDVTSGDFNDDGNLDVAFGIVNKNYNLVYFGDGTGSFSYGASIGSAIASGSVTTKIQARDVNGDDIDDLISTSIDDGVINVNISNGDGTFAPRVSYAVGGAPNGLAVADIDGDGEEDITFTTTGGTQTIGVLLGNGDGTFGSPTTIAATGSPLYLTVAELNGDGRNDLISQDYTGTTGRIFLSNRVGTPVPSIENVPKNLGPLRDTESIFSSGRTLRTKNEASVVFVDAKALKAQIQKNIEILDEATEKLGNALQSLRATGLGLLEASRSVSTTSADAVVSSVVSAVRRNGATSRDANLLDPIISATLLRESTGAN